MTATSAWVEGKNSYFFGTRAQLITSDRECAWAEKHIIHNEAHAWLLGKYAEANKANSNGQYFELDGLRMAKPTISHSPLNINHGGHAVGAFVAAELVFPTEAAAGEPQNPYIEALAVIWKAHYPDAFRQVQQAHAEGNLFFSMEAVPKKIGCIGDRGCGQVFDYAGIMSPSYCAHINERSSDRDLIEPHFTAGALIIPPVRPGWSEADVHSLMARHVEESEKLLAEVAQEVKPDPDLEWQMAMASLIQFEQYARSFTTEERHALAKSGKALKDGSYPIVNVEDLKNAIQAIGRAKNPGAAKSHIIKRAKALGATDLLPESWKA